MQEDEREREMGGKRGSICVSLCTCQEKWCLMFVCVCVCVCVCAYVRATMGEGCVCVSTIDMEAEEKGSEGCRSICDLCLCACCVCLFHPSVLTLQRSCREVRCGRPRCITGPLVVNTVQHFIHFGEPEWNVRLGLNVALPAGVIHQLSSILSRWFSVLLALAPRLIQKPTERSQLRIVSSAFSFTFLPGYPGLCFLDRHSKHLRTLHAFAEWVTRRMTDCVWSAKWAEDSTTASRSVRQQHVALAEELSFLHSEW